MKFSSEGIPSAPLHLLPLHPAASAFQPTHARGALSDTSSPQRDNNVQRTSLSPPWLQESKQPTGGVELEVTRGWSTGEGSAAVTAEFELQCASLFQRKTCDSHCTVSKEPCVSHFTCSTGPILFVH